MSFSISHEQLPNYTRCDSNWFVFSIFNLLQLSPTARSLQELGFALYNAFRRLFDIPDLFTVFPQKYFIQRRRTPTHLSTVHETVFRKLILITKIKKSLYGRGRPRYIHSCKASLYYTWCSTLLWVLCKSSDYLSLLRGGSNNYLLAKRFVALKILLYSPVKQNGTQSTLRTDKYRRSNVNEARLEELIYFSV